MFRRLEILAIIPALVALGAPAIARPNYRYYYSGPAYSVPYSPYDYSGRDPASQPYLYRWYADQGYAPPERGAQGANFW